MHVQIQAPHCPVCAAPVSPAEGAEQIVCEYCDAVLLLERGRAAAPGRPAADLRLRKGMLGSEPSGTSWEPVPMAEELVQHVAPRFEMCMLEQAPEDPLELFRWIELPGERFAVVCMHCTGENGDWVPTDFKALLEIMEESLADDSDPGLAANLALEELFARPDPMRPADLRLCCAVVVFDPLRHRARTFAAGYGETFWWVSTEEGRSIRHGGGKPPLERRDLGKAGDVFSNDADRELAASDLLVVVSAAARGFGRQHTGAMRGLLEVLNTHLGEHPLRVVTLAKNRYWEDRGAEQADRGPRPFRWLAVRPVLPEPVGEDVLKPRIESVETPSFDLAIARCEGDRLERVELPPDVHGPREALVWMGPAATDEATGAHMDLLMEHVRAVLGREGHGDNEHPQAVAKSAMPAFAQAGVDPAGLRFFVLHLGYQHNAVRWFCQRLAQPICLEARGIRSDRELGWVRGAFSGYPRDGARLWFPGPMELQGDPHLPGELAQGWPGGKASRLYEALRLHWRTRRSDRVLTRFLLGAWSDGSGPDQAGSLLITSKKS